MTDFDVSLSAVSLHRNGLRRRQSRSSGLSGTHSFRQPLQLPDDTLNGQTIPEIPPKADSDHYESVFKSALDHWNSIDRLNGWSAVAELAKRDDEEKIKGYKEDIDTLLVFAGLFATAVTAFLVVSFQSLQRDTSVEALQVLHQIARQTSSFSLQGNMLNATSTHEIHTHQDFHPSQAAVKINVLWFASLIVSLITASISMLVKQWLREYMSVEHPSPHERLRVRHFRITGLAQWGIFEIAAVLPLLLQISLGLFLTGLCYFTMEANHSVGITSIVLVAAWTFFLVITVFAPAFSSRCPYKTKVFKNIFTAFRCWFYGLILRLSDSLKPFQFPHAISRYIRAISDWSRRRTPKRYPEDRPFDERDAIKFTEIDHHILLAMDEVHADDELLGSTLTDALVQLHPPISTLLNFLKTILKSRLVVRDMVADPWMLDLRGLDRPTWAAITTLVARFLDEIISGEYALNDRTMVAMTWFIPIVLAKSPHRLPPRAVHVVRGLLRHQFTSICGIIIQSCPKPKPGIEDHRFLLFLDRLQNLSQYASLETSLLLGCLENVMCLRYVTDNAGRMPLKRCVHTIEEPQEWPWKKEMSRAVFDKAVEVLLRLLKRDFPHHGTTPTPWAPLSTKLSRAVLGLVEVHENSSGTPLRVSTSVDDIVRNSSAYSGFLATTLEFAIQRPSSFMMSESMSSILVTLGHNTELHNTPQVMAIIHNYVKSQPDVVRPIDNLKMCFMLVTMTASSHDQAAILTEILPSIMSMQLKLDSEQEHTDFNQEFLSIAQPLLSRLRCMKRLWAYLDSQRDNGSKLVETGLPHPIDDLIRKLEDEVSLYVES